MTESSGRKTDRIFEEIGKNGMACSLSDDYVICFSSNAIVYSGDSRYLVGSALAIKTRKDSRIKDLTDIDIKKIRALFQMGIVNLTFGEARLGDTSNECNRRWV
ncbi:MAG: hypothetical protein IJ695_00215 [Butyrivibrio sp.]|nr:hypothetical protein [Butyrivibrio sp.]